MEWKSGQEGVQHAKAFAEEFTALLKKYGAEVDIDTTYYGYEGSSSEIVVSFDCCAADVAFTHCTGDDEADVRDKRIRL